MQWNDMKLDEMKERMRWDEVNLGWHEMKSNAMTCNGMKWHDMRWNPMNERMNEWTNEWMKEWRNDDMNEWSMNESNGMKRYDVKWKNEWLKRNEMEWHEWIWH